MSPAARGRAHAQAGRFGLIFSSVIAKLLHIVPGGRENAIRTDTAGIPQTPSASWRGWIVRPLHS